MKRHRPHIRNEFYAHILNLASWEKRKKTCFWLTKIRWKWSYDIICLTSVVFFFGELKRVDKRLLKFAEISILNEWDFNLEMTLIVRISCAYFFIYRSGICFTTLVVFERWRAQRMNQSELRKRSKQKYHTAVFLYSLTVAVLYIVLVQNKLLWSLLRPTCL